MAIPQMTDSPKKVRKWLEKNYGAKITNDCWIYDTPFLGFLEMYLMAEYTDTTFYIEEGFAIWEDEVIGSEGKKYRVKIIKKSYEALPKVYLYPTPYFVPQDKIWMDGSIDFSRRYECHEMAANLHQRIVYSLNVNAICEYCGQY